MEYLTQNRIDPSLMTLSLKKVTKFFVTYWSQNFLYRGEFFLSLIRDKYKNPYTKYLATKFLDKDLCLPQFPSLTLLETKIFIF